MIPISDGPFHAEAVLSREVFVQYGRLRTVSNEVQATVPRQYANSFAPNLIAAYISKYIILAQVRFLESDFSLQSEFHESQRFYLTLVKNFTLTN